MNDRLLTPVEHFGWLLRGHPAVIKYLFVFSGERFSNNSHVGVLTGMEVTIEKVNLTNELSELSWIC